MDLNLTWTATRFDGGPPEPDDGTLIDEGVHVGRVHLAVVDGANQGAWVWFCYSSGFVGARFPFPTQGRVADKEAAKEACETSYRALLAHRPGAREMIRAMLARTAASQGGRRSAPGRRREF